MQAQSADGVLHDFPDGTDPAVIDRVMKSYASSNAGAAPQTAGSRASLARRGVDTSAPPQPADSTWSDVGKGITQAATGFNEGLAKTVGRAADVIPYYADRAIGGEGVHPVENTIRKYFVDPAGPPTTPVQNAVRQGGDFAGENMVNLVPGMGLATSGARSGVSLAEQAAPGIVNKVRGAADSVLDWMRANPGSATLSDTAGAFESGAGGQVGRQIAQDNGGSEDSQRLAELTGQFAAPSAFALWSKISPTAFVARNAVKGASKVAQMLPESVLPESMQSGATPASRTAENLAYANREGKYADPNEPAPVDPNWVVRQMDAGANARTAKAADTVRDEMSQIQARPEAAANSSIADTLKKNIPGFAPGVAKETGDPALLKLQQRLESNATGDDLRNLQTNYDKSAQSLRDKFNSLAPKPPGDVPPQDAAVQAATGKVAQEQAALRQQQDAVQGELGKLSGTLPDADRATAGAKFRDIHDQAAAASDARTTELRNAIPQDAPIEVAPAKPSEVSGDGFNVGGAPAETMPVKDLLDRRASINQQLRQYQSASARSVDDVKQMQGLQAERDKLDAAINNADVPGMAQYRDYYRDEHVPKFEEGAGRDVSRYNRFGYDKNQVPDEKVLAQFGGPNNISAAKQFTATHGNNPEAVQLMADHQLGRLKAEALDPQTGALKEGSVDKFLTKNKELLDALPPDVRKAVAAKNPDQVYAKLADLEQRQRALADTNVAGMIGKTPEKVVDSALNDWQVMRDLKAKVAGNPQNEAALTRAVMDRAPDVMDAKAFASWLDGHDRVLRQVITPQHLQSLKDIAKASEIQTQLPRPTGTAEMPKSTLAKAGAAIGTPIKSLLQRFLAVAQGRVGKPYTAFDIGTRMIDSFSERETDAIWKEALFNPKVADTLAQVVKNKGATGLQLSRLHNYLLTVGSADTGQDYPHQ